MCCGYPQMCDHVIIMVHARSRSWGCKFTSPFCGMTLHSKKNSGQITTSAQCAALIPGTALCTRKNVVPHFHQREINEITIALRMVMNKHRSD